MSCRSTGRLSVMRTGSVRDEVHDGDITNHTDDLELAAERRDLLDALATHRDLLRQTADRLTDEQARGRTTVSSLTVGGLIEHVASTEAGWAEFMREVRWVRPIPRRTGRSPIRPQ